jgi:transposase
MAMTLTDVQRVELDAAASAEKRVRIWKRYQAVLLLGEGHAPEAVAHHLKCGVSSLYNWAAAWRRSGITGLTEGRHPGRARRLDAAGEALLGALLAGDPQAQGHQATGWTVLLLRTELAAAGYPMSARTVRRAVHRLGYGWKRPQYVLGRPDPEYETKKRG